MKPCLSPRVGIVSVAAAASLSWVSLTASLVGANDALNIEVESSFGEYRTRSRHVVILAGCSINSFKNNTASVDLPCMPKPPDVQQAGG